MRFPAALIIGILAAFSVFAPARALAANPPARTCAIADMASLAACMRNAANVDVFAITADLSCASEHACCPDRHALFELRGLAGKRIEGNGHILRRTAGQHKCPAISLNGASDITVDSLTLDEDAASPPCELAEHACPSTVLVVGSHAVVLDRVRIFSGKGYVVKVWNTDGFTFSRSTIVDAGIIGLYVGHYKFGPSKNVSITGSVFAHSRTNGLAIQGAYADDPAHPVLIANNTFIDNHWHGLWPVPGTPGAVTTGGQMLVGDGRNIQVLDNVFSAHDCANCFRSKGVAAIEFADVVPPPGGVQNLLIAGNTAIFGGTSGVAIAHDAGSPASAVTIRGNRAIGYQVLARVPQEFIGSGNVRLQSVPVSASLSGLHPPVPGIHGPDNPVFLCAPPSPASQFASTDRACGGKGAIEGVLGFATR